MPAGTSRIHRIQCTSVQRPHQLDWPNAFINEWFRDGVFRICEIIREPLEQLTRLDLGMRLQAFKQCPGTASWKLMGTRPSSAQSPVKMGWCTYLLVLRGPMIVSGRVFWDVIQKPMRQS